MPGECSYPVIWEQLDPVRPEEVNRILQNVNTTTYVLDQCSSWLVKAAWEVLCG